MVDPRILPEVCEAEAVLGVRTGRSEPTGVATGAPTSYSVAIDVDGHSINLDRTAGPTKSNEDAVASELADLNAKSPPLSTQISVASTSEIAAGADLSLFRALSTGNIRQPSSIREDVGKPHAETPQQLPQGPLQQATESMGKATPAPAGAHHHPGTASVGSVSQLRVARAGSSVPQALLQKPTGPQSVRATVVHTEDYIAGLLRSNDAATQRTIRTLSSGTDSVLGRIPAEEFMRLFCVKSGLCGSLLEVDIDEFKLLAHPMRLAAPSSPPTAATSEDHSNLTSPIPISGQTGRSNSNFAESHGSGKETNSGGGGGGGSTPTSNSSGGFNFFSLVFALRCPREDNSSKSKGAESSESDTIHLRRPGTLTPEYAAVPSTVVSAYASVLQSISQAWAAEHTRSGFLEEELRQLQSDRLAFLGLSVEAGGSDSSGAAPYATQPQFSPGSEGDAMSRTTDESASKPLDSPEHASLLSVDVADSSKGGPSGTLYSGSIATSTGAATSSAVIEASSKVFRRPLYLAVLSPYYPLGYMPVGSDPSGNICKTVRTGTRLRIPRPSFAFIHKNCLKNGRSSAAHCYSLHDLVSVRDSAGQDNDLSSTDPHSTELLTLEQVTLADIRPVWALMPISATSHWRFQYLPYQGPVKSKSKQGVRRPETTTSPGRWLGDNTKRLPGFSWSTEEIAHSRHHLAQSSEASGITVIPEVESGVESAPTGPGAHHLTNSSSSVETKTQGSVTSDQTDSGGAMGPMNQDLGPEPSPVMSRYVIATELENWHPLRQNSLCDDVDAFVAAESLAGPARAARGVHPPPSTNPAVTPAPSDLRLHGRALTAGDDISSDYKVDQGAGKLSDIERAYDGKYPAAAPTAEMDGKTELGRLRLTTRAGLYLAASAIGKTRLARDLRKLFHGLRSKGECTLLVNGRVRLSVKLGATSLTKSIHNSPLALPTSTYSNPDKSSAQAYHALMSQLFSPQFKPRQLLTIALPHLLLRSYLSPPLRRAISPFSATSVWDAIDRVRLRLSSQATVPFLGAGWISGLDKLPDAEFEDQLNAALEPLQKVAMASDAELEQKRRNEIRSILRSLTQASSGQYKDDISCEVPNGYESLVLTVPRARLISSVSPFASADFTRFLLAIHPTKSLALLEAELKLPLSRIKMFAHHLVSAGLARRIEAISPHTVFVPAPWLLRALAFLTPRVIAAAQTAKQRNQPTATGTPRDGLQGPFASVAAHASSQTQSKVPCEPSSDASNQQTAAYPDLVHPTVGMSSVFLLPEDTLFTRPTGRHGAWMESHTDYLANELQGEAAQGAGLANALKFAPPASLVCAALAMCYSFLAESKLAEQQGTPFPSGSLPHVLSKWFRRPTPLAILLRLLPPASQAGPHSPSTIPPGNGSVMRADGISPVRAGFLRMCTFLLAAGALRIRRRYIYFWKQSPFSPTSIANALQIVKSEHEHQAQTTKTRESVRSLDSEFAMATVDSYGSPRASDVSDDELDDDCLLSTLDNRSFGFTNMEDNLISDDDDINQEQEETGGFGSPPHTRRQGKPEFAQLPHELAKLLFHLRRYRLIRLTAAVMSNTPSLPLKTSTAVDRLFVDLAQANEAVLGATLNALRAATDDEHEDQRHAIRSRLIHAYGSFGLFEGGCSEVALCAKTGLSLAELNETLSMFPSDYVEVWY